jgi:hypothetical protein
MMLGFLGCCISRYGHRRFLGMLSMPIKNDIHHQTLHATVYLYSIILISKSPLLQDPTPQNSKYTMFIPQNHHSNPSLPPPPPVPPSSLRSPHLSLQTSLSSLHKSFTHGSHELPQHVPRSGGGGGSLYARDAARRSCFVRVPLRRFFWRALNFGVSAGV